MQVQSVADPIHHEECSRHVVGPGDLVRLGFAEDLEPLTDSGAHEQPDIASLVAQDVNRTSGIERRERIYLHGVLSVSWHFDSVRDLHVRALNHLVAPDDLPAVLVGRDLLAIDRDARAAREHGVVRPARGIFVVCLIHCGEVLLGPLRERGSREELGSHGFTDMNWAGW